jgi:hypothetical protein
MAKTCSPIRLKLPGPAETLFPQAKAAMRKAGGTMRGNAISGSGSVNTDAGKVSFTYRTTGENLIITVTDKNYFLPCGTIASELRAGMAKIKAPAAPRPAPSPDAGPGDAAPDAPGEDPLDPFGGPGRDIPGAYRPSAPAGVQRIQVAELQELLVALGAPTQGLTDGKWGDFTAAAMEQVLWNERGIAYQVYPVSLYAIDVEPDGLLELLRGEASQKKRNKMWPWGLGLVAVVGWMVWRPRGSARR